MKKILFYILSFMWGQPMTLIGFIVAGALLVMGYRPKKYGWCYHFERGDGWGGINLGLVFVTDKNSSVSTKNHEHGHALQNCIWGPLFPFVIAIPSVCRCGIRMLQSKKGKQLPPYDSVWFEGQASKWGDAFISNLEGDDYENN
jgi:hypothetical protein